MTAEQVEARINSKLEQLSGLVSKEGAANIVASELGIRLLDQTGKIKDIYTGMRGIENAAKVIEAYEVREFARADGTMSKVASMLIGDETGTIRVVCWGQIADTIRTLKPDTTIRIVGAYCRDNNGRKELHCNEQTKIQLNPPGVIVGEIQRKVSSQRKSMKELTEQDDNVEVLGTVVQVFDLKFYPVCPQCNKRVTEENGTFTCAEHNVVSPEHNTILNIVLDDGTDNMRCVFFKNQAMKLLNCGNEQLQTFRLNPATFEDVKTRLLGEQYKLIGRVKKNDYFQRLEIVVQLVFPASAKEELARLETQSSNSTSGPVYTPPTPTTLPRTNVSEPTIEPIEERIQ